MDNLGNLYEHKDFHHKKFRADVAAVDISTSRPLTAAYGNGSFSINTYASIDEAIEAKDSLGATKLLMASDDDYKPSAKQNEFFKDTHVYQVLANCRESSHRKTLYTRADLPITSDDTKIDAFLYVLQHTRATAQLWIDSDDPKESHIIKALKAVCTIDSIRTLNLTGTAIINANIAAALSDLIRRNTNLRKVEATWNMSDTLAQFTAAMQSNTTLRELIIERILRYGDHSEKKHPSLKADDLIAFAKMLETNTGLETLSLCGADMPDDVAEAFAAAFEKNNTLKSIDLSECMISAKGLSLLAKAFESKQRFDDTSIIPKLKTINLTANDPGGAIYLKELQDKYRRLEIYYDNLGTCFSCTGKRFYIELPKPAQKFNMK